MTLTEYMIAKAMEAEIDNNWKRFINSPKKAIIYGAGRQARVVIDLCHMFHKEYFCLMTTDSYERWGLLPREDELPLYLIHEFPGHHDSNDYDVIVAMNSRYNAEIAELLQRNHFYHVYQIEDWGITNEKLRENYYKSYFEYYGAEFLLDTNCERYLKYVLNDSVFQMYYPYSGIFQSNTLGELGNIVMPSLFQDDSVCCLGPYEYGERIKLNKNDVVLDLGANIGLFSCVAAAKGCKVYAFEPEGIPVINYLRMNAELNENITVVAKAVADKSGEKSFYYNDRLDLDFDMCRSSIHRELEPEYREIVVNAITIDDFVKENNIEHVNFIKSHIEYAENDMLKGAVGLLGREAPVLSFYSQKALDAKRYREIEEIILQANPRYQFEYHKRRMYAYVPSED